jgi:hypothetical protein
MAAELETNATAVEPGDSNESNPTTGEAEERQPKQKKAPEVVSADDFRKFQATKDREVAQARNEAQRLSQQMRQMEDRLHQLSVRDLPEDQQQVAHLQRQAQLAEQRAMAAEQYAREVESMQAIRQEWNDIHLETGMPLEEIEAMYNDRKTAREIWKVAVGKYAKDGRRNRRRDDDEDDDEERTAKAQRNRTDAGEGKGKSPEAERTQRLNKHVADKDALSWYQEKLARK